MIGVTSGDGSVRRPGCRSLSITSSIWRNATTGATSNREDRIHDPGLHAGDFTTIAVTYHDVVGTDGQLAPFETFTLRRPRRD
jgi:hypothetical protein